MFKINQAFLVAKPFLSDLRSSPPKKLADAQLQAFLCFRNRAELDPSTLRPKHHGSEAAYLIAEMTALRTEIQTIKERETKTEQIAMLTLAGLYIAIFAGELPWVFALLPVFVGIFGHLRFGEMLRNNAEIDQYLRQIEFLFRWEGAWVNYFYTTRHVHNYFKTRRYFWRLFHFFSISGLIAMFFLMATTSPYQEPLRDLVKSVPWVESK